MSRCAMQRSTRPAYGRIRTRKRRRAMVRSRMSSRHVVLALTTSFLLLGGGAAHAQSVLFTVDTGGGTLVPVPHRAGTYELTLHGVAPSALYFQNRPGDRQGVLGLRAMFGLLFASGQPRPNAVVNAVVAHGRQESMGVKLSPPRYSPARRLLRIRVVRLAQTVAGGKRTRTDVVLPRHFEEASLFIDNVTLNAASTANVLNPASEPQTVTINRGASFQVPATGGYDNWAPGSASVAYNPDGIEAGTLGPGTNVVEVSSPESVTYFVEVPQQAVDSLQLYLFPTADGSPGRWVLAVDGNMVGSGT